jgi:hypothetical protein
LGSKAGNWVHDAIWNSAVVLLCLLGSSSSRVGESWNPSADGKEMRNNENGEKKTYSFNQDIVSLTQGSSGPGVSSNMVTIFWKKTEYSKAPSLRTQPEPLKAMRACVKYMISEYSCQRLGLHV